MNTTETLGKRLLTPKEIAEYLAVSHKTIYKWSFQGKVPFLKLGKAIRFDLGEINQWLKEHRGRQND